MTTDKFSPNSSHISPRDIAIYGIYACTRRENFINYRSVMLGNGKTLILRLNGIGSEWLGKRMSANKVKHLSIMLKSCRMTLSSPCNVDE